MKLIGKSSSWLVSFFKMSNRDVRWISSVAIMIFLRYGDSDCKKKRQNSFSWKQKAAVPLILLTPIVETREDHVHGFQSGNNLPRQVYSLEDSLLHSPGAVSKIPYEQKLQQIRIRVIQAWKFRSIYLRHGSLCGSLPIACLGLF